jgi:PIN domain
VSIHERAAASLSAPSLALGCLSQQSRSLHQECHLGDTPAASATLVATALIRRPAGPAACRLRNRPESHIERLERMSGLLLGEMRNDLLMLVILDSTVLVADRPLQGDIRLLLAASERGDLKMGVSDVTVREAINKVRESARDALEKVDSAARSLRKLGQSTAYLATDLTPERAAADYERFLRGELDRHGVEIYAFPTISHEAVVERALMRRKPFDSEGRKGYRDALIWETIRQQAQDSGQPVAFISANPRDFAQGGKAGQPLDQSLTDELHEGAGVTLWHTVTDFVEAHVRPALDVATALNGRLAEDAGFARLLTADVELAAENSDPDLQIDPRALVDDWSTEYELADAYLKTFELTSGVTISNALPLEPGQFLITLSAEADADVEFRVRAISSDAGALVRSVTGTTMRSLVVRIEATYQPDPGIIRNVRLVSASSLVDPQQERLQRFRAYLRSEPARRAWAKRAREVAMSWAKDQGYKRLVGESPDSLDLRSDDGAIVIEFVADPRLVTWLQNAANSLGIWRSMIGPATRTVIVVPYRPEPALSTRVMNSLDPPIEIYVLADDALLPV